MRKELMSVMLMVCAWQSAEALELEGVPPTSVDLQAAYCVGLLDAQKKNVESIPEASLREAAATYLAEANAARARISGYIAPRVKFLEASGLLSAREQGARDFSEMGSAYRSCVVSCKSLACYESCAKAEPHSSRMDRCLKPNFLPY